MPFEITVLGSGTIIPTKDRSAPSIHVRCVDEDFLIDCGPCTLNELERSGVRFTDVRRIFLTHYHPDHTLGTVHLLCALNQMPPASMGRVTIYGPDGLGDFFKKMNLLYPSSVPKYNFLEIEELSLSGVVVNITSDYSIRTAKTVHTGSSIAYRFHSGERSFVYTGDTELSESLIAFSKGCDLLITECSFPESRKVDGHMIPSDIASLAREAQVGAVLIIHMYPEALDSDIVGIVKKNYQGEVILGYDSFRITI